MRQLKHSEIKDIREEILLEQEGICPLCNDPIEEGDATLDHDHKSTLIRGVLCRTCNSGEGRIERTLQRYGIDKRIDLISFLENLIGYYKRDQYEMIHPSEKVKEPKLKKASYNKLAKLIKNDTKAKKMPPYPLSKKLTKPLRELYKKYNLQPEFYKVPTKANTNTSKNIKETNASK